ncbi:hypothetical protein OH77DRAFT_1428305 [Trametes cingulata]|nr:hypothetical protein OH77DRAFT_1428305 [Trametes cingulata]
MDRTLSSASRRCGSRESVIERTIGGHASWTIDRRRWGAIHDARRAMHRDDWHVPGSCGSGTDVAVSYSSPTLRTPPSERDFPFGDGAYVSTASDVVRHMHSRRVACAAESCPSTSQTSTSLLERFNWRSLDVYMAAESTNLRRRRRHRLC